MSQRCDNCGEIPNEDGACLCTEARNYANLGRMIRDFPLSPPAKAAVKDLSSVPVLSAEEAAAIAEHLRIFVDSPNPKSTSRTIDRLAASHESLRQQVISLSEQIDASKK